MRPVLMAVTIIGLKLLLMVREAQAQNVVTNPVECGGTSISMVTLTQSITIPASGTFTAPTKCTYTVQSSADSTVMFAITSMNIGTGGSCIEDYVKVADNEQLINTTHYIFCGSQPPVYYYQSTTNSVYVEFKVSNNWQNAKLTGIFTKQTNAPAVIPGAVCGSSVLTLSSDSAQLTVPAPGQTLSGSNICTYQITGNDEKRLALKIKRMNIDYPVECLFQLGTNATCNTGYVVVGESQQTIATSKYIYCGTNAPTETFNSNTNRLYVIVATTNSNDFFEAEYSKINAGFLLNASKMGITGTLVIQILLCQIQLIPIINKDCD